MQYIFRYRKAIGMLCILTIVLSLPIKGWALTSKTSGPYTLLIQEDICMISDYDPSENLTGKVSVASSYGESDGTSIVNTYSVVGIKTTAFRGKTLASLDVLVGDGQRVENYGYQLEKYAFQKTEIGLSSDDPKAVFRGGAITSIGAGAFEEAKIGCDLVFENIKGKICADAFCRAEIDGTLHLYGTIDEIETHAFEGIRVNKLTLPKNTYYIADEAFKDTNFSVWALPDNLKKLGSRIFEGCKLQTITLPKSNEDREIAADAFPDQEGLIIVIPESLTELSSFHFENYQNLIFQTAPNLSDDSPVISYLKEKNLSYKVGEQGEVVTPSSPEKPTQPPTEKPTQTPTTAEPTLIPTEEPTQIPTEEPTHRPLVEPTQKPVVTQMPTPATEQTPAPERTQDPNVNNKKQNRTYSIKNIKYKIKSGSSATVTGATKTGLKKISIPATVKIEGKLYKVTGIKSRAFRKQKKLQTVTIGNFVADVGDEAFAYCSRLKRIQFGTGVKSLGRKVLYKDRKLKKILFKGKKLKKIGKKAFYGVPSQVDIRAVRAKVKAYAKLINRSKK